MSSQLPSTRYVPESVSEQLIGSDTEFIAGYSSVSLFVQCHGTTKNCATLWYPPNCCRRFSDCLSRRGAKPKGWRIRYNLPDEIVYQTASELSTGPGAPKWFYRITATCTISQPPVPMVRTPARFGDRCFRYSFHGASDTMHLPEQC